MSQLVGNIIIANGTYTVPILPGRYALQAGGAFGGGSLAVSWQDAYGNTGAFPSSPLTAAGGFEFVTACATLSLTLSGATSPSITLSTGRL